MPNSKIENLKIKNHTKNTGFNRSGIIGMSPKYCLPKKLQQGFHSQSKEDLQDSMNDFEDYLKIIEE